MRPVSINRIVFCDALAGTGSSGTGKQGETMTAERDKEAFSALMDGEVTDLDLRRLLRDVDDAQGQTWARWHLARSFLHGHESAGVPPDFARQVQQAIQQESQGGRVPGFLPRALVAASVAAATVVGWQFYSGWSGQDNVMPVVAEVQDIKSPAAAEVRPLAEASLVSRQLQRRVSVQESRLTAAPLDHDQLRPMLIRHNEYTARFGSQGLAPNARSVSLDTQQGRR